MSPITICALFVVILVFVLLGLYVGINIRYFFLQREYKKEYQSRSKNILTEEEKQMLKKKHKEEARQKQEREKAKKKRERQRKKEQRKKKREEKKKNSFFHIHKSTNVKNEENQNADRSDRTKKKVRTAKEKKDVSWFSSIRRFFLKKDTTINLKDRIPDETESYTSMVCTMEGDEETADRVKENRTSQDAKYGYSKKKTENEK